VIFDPGNPWRSNPNVPEGVKHLILRQKQNMPPDNPDGLKKSWALQYGLPFPYDEGTAAEHYEKQNPKRWKPLAQWELARLPSAVVRDILAEISVRQEFVRGE
jgi:hypothetical protein